MLALLATACGSNDDAVSDEPPAATTTSTQTTMADDEEAPEPDSAPAESAAGARQLDLRRRSVGRQLVCVVCEWGAGR